MIRQRLVLSILMGAPADPEDPGKGHRVPVTSPRRRRRRNLDGDEINETKSAASSRVDRRVHPRDDSGS
jgi:hypothetical protein